MKTSVVLVFCLLVIIRDAMSLTTTPSPPAPTTEPLASGRPEITPTPASTEEPPTWIPEITPTPPTLTEEPTTWIPEITPTPPTPTEEPPTWIPEITPSPPTPTEEPPTWIPEITPTPPTPTEEPPTGTPENTPTCVCPTPLEEPQTGTPDATPTPPTPTPEETTTPDFITEISYTSTATERPPCLYTVTLSEQCSSNDSIPVVKPDPCGTFKNCRTVLKLSYEDCFSCLLTVSLCSDDGTACKEACEHQKPPKTGRCVSGFPQAGCKCDVQNAKTCLCK